ncbi:hypothetical protein BDB00DRAFT_183229 [Zychaea mexicana]|uniref:uncharacterized protein n=1 Tax=Zychaea mexicana TaxID=64656 RepID=UPI0022FEDDC5|nr:uncharacterized protein BDB00DRAFT_183229 [Zychaea mexicana]KAI9479522.1 hypothetical protein BDB00DRAFT_183229 [Zychaea mexicana]
MGSPLLQVATYSLPPDEFQLGDPKKRQQQSSAISTSSFNDNGYRIQFLFYGVATKDDTTNNGTTILPTSRIHVSLYTRKRNPNLAYYFGDTTQQITESDIQVWLDQERNNLQTANTYTLDLGAYSSMTYQLQTHLCLKDRGWNNIGFAPSFNEVPEITTHIAPV